MKYVFQPVLNLDDVKALQTVPPERFALFEKQNLDCIQLLSSKLPDDMLARTIENFPDQIRAGQFFLWFVDAYTDEHIREVAASLNPEIKLHTILFNYTGEDPREILESTNVAGLVTEATVHNWKADLPKTAFLMGVGHGLYGLKAAFEEGEFVSAFKTMKSSEHYMIFYNYTDYRLDQLLYKYIVALSE